MKEKRNPLVRPYKLRVTDADGHEIQSPERLPDKDTVDPSNPELALAQGSTERKRFTREELKSAILKQFDDAHGEQVVHHHYADMAVLTLFAAAAAEAKSFTREELREIMVPVVQDSVLSTYTEANDTADNIIKALISAGAVSISEEGK